MQKLDIQGQLQIAGAPESGLMPSNPGWRWERPQLGTSERLTFVSHYSAADTAVLTPDESLQGAEAKGTTPRQTRPSSPRWARPSAFPGTDAQGPPLSFPPAPQSCSQVQASKFPSRYSDPPPQSRDVRTHTPHPFSRSLPLPETQRRDSAPVTNRRAWALAILAAS